MKDLDCLKRAVAALGWQFNEGKREYRWYGKWVDDSPLPRDFFETQAEYERVKAMPREERKAYMTKALGMCNHEISIPDARYSVGVRRKQDGTYTFVFDWFGGHLAKHLDDPRYEKNHRGGKLLQAYQVEVAKKVARQRGLQFKETRRADGKVELEVLINR